jgi:hypothetical protein
MFNCCFLVDRENAKPMIEILMLMIEMGTFWMEAYEPLSNLPIEVCTKNTLNNE